MQVAGETQRKKIPQQCSLSCILIFIAPMQTLCGELTLAGYQMLTQQLSFLLLNRRGGENKTGKVCVLK